MPTTKPLAWSQGWWKTRCALNRYESEGRYSLIVSLHVPETDVQLTLSRS
ncbi:hypothetical protein LNO81_31520 [Klebsiella variicola subsp. variicola]|nr:hypothetical protein [Klebsiella variicola subsp. variicola]